MLDLIERLEKAAGPNFEMEHLIAEAAYPHLRGFRRPGAAGWVGPGWSTSAPPPYTASLDAIMALIGEKSPLRGPIALEMAGSGFCAIESTEPCQDPVTAWGNTPALACCIALLRALQTKEAGHGG